MNLLLPTLFGQTEPLPDELRELVNLVTSTGGPGYTRFEIGGSATIYYINVNLMTPSHVKSITAQSTLMVTSEQSIEELKKYHHSLRIAFAKSKMENIDASLSRDLLQLVNQSRDKGASSWLNALLLEEQGLAMNKQEFRDSLRLCYNLPLFGLPSHCACGDKFTVGHAVSCKKGGICSPEA